MTDKLRVGIIGSGGIAEGAHAPWGTRRSPTIASWWPCCDVRPERAKAFAERFDLAHWYTDYHELLALSELDAGPRYARPRSCTARQTVAALDAGLHVLCEKPMAMNVAEAQDMVAAAERAGKVLTIGHQQRFTPAAQAVKRAVDAGELGDIYYAKDGVVTQPRRAHVGRVPYQEAQRWWPADRHWCSCSRRDDVVDG